MTQHTDPQAECKKCGPLGLSVIHRVAILEARVRMLEMAGNDMMLWLMHAKLNEVAAQAALERWHAALGDS